VEYNVLFAKGWFDGEIVATDTVLLENLPEPVAPTKTAPLPGEREEVKTLQTPKIEKPTIFGATVTVSTKGISNVPNLSLGKPAAIFDLVVGKDRFRFEPSLRFGLNGKPWSFIFWFRYDLVRSEKFNLTLGTHPAFSFRTRNVTENGIDKEIIGVQRYLVGEITPTFKISPNITVGPYYFYSRGMEKYMYKNNHFLSFRGSVRFNIAEKYYLRVNPQTYFLKMDQYSGFYWGSTFSIGKNGFPLSLSSLINKEIKSNIPGSEDFLWNISLVYNFRGEYTRR